MPDRRLKANFNSYLPTGQKLDLDELAALFPNSEDDTAKGARKNMFVSRHTLPLWEGFFGNFEGPLVVPLTTKQVSQVSGNVRAVNTEESRWHGLGKTVRTANVTASELPGSDLTALSAYVAKLAPNASLPAVRLSYEGPRPTPDQYSSTRENPNYMRDIYGFAGAILSLRPTYKRNSRSRDPAEELFFTGEAAITTDYRGDNLPFHVVTQSQVLLGLVSDNREQELYSLYGARDRTQLSVAWQEAMAERTPRDAALSIRNTLGA